ncbi:MAG: hypothetical protein LBL46_00995 [Rickettsiales bacterium]|jgi:hypothetical protein|nr:hypothetical protein [Rickettsiales bacterium]
MKYDPLKLFSKELKSQLRDKLPDCRFSVRTPLKNCVDVSLMRSPIPIDFPEPLRKSRVRNYMQIPIHLDKRRDFLRYNRPLQELWDIVADTIRAIYPQAKHSGDHWCSFNYYIYFYVGKWNKPYVCAE